MMNQLEFEANEIGAKLLRTRPRGGFQLDAGDQFGIDRDPDQDRMVENLDEGLAAGLESPPSSAAPRRRCSDRWSQGHRAPSGWFAPL